MHPYLTISTKVIDLYYTLLALGLLVGSLVAFFYLRKSLRWYKAACIVVVMVGGALFGAHLGHCFFHWSKCRLEPLWMLDVWRGGHSFLGAPALCALLLALLSASLPWVRFLNVADAFSLGLPLGLSIARIGCYLRGCCWGIPIQNESFFYGWSFKLLDHRLTAVHPVQLYSAAANLVIFLLLVGVTRTCKIEGLVTGLCFSLYAVARFTLEFYRGDTPRLSSFYNLSPHQLLCIPIFMCACSLVIFLYVKHRTRGGT